MAHPDQGFSKSPGDELKSCAVSMSIRAVDHGYVDSFKVCEKFHSTNRAIQIIQRPSVFPDGFFFFSDCYFKHL